ncbi:MAG: DUF1207 domain-containing protein [Chlamydiales bacterium]|nr:DUF1207 domain-containing protein [Chlamydiales bacterium]
MMGKTWIYRLFFCMFSCFAATFLTVPLEAMEAGNIPCNPVQPCPTNDAYLEGYLQGLVDANYYEFRVNIVVKHGWVYLSHPPASCELLSRIIADIKDVPGVCGVHVVCKTPPDIPSIQCAKWRRRPCCEISGMWLPEFDELFQPLIADPRQPMFSAAYRAGDKVIGQSCAAVAFGDPLPIYRWFGVLPWRGDLQIAVEGCVFAVFNLDTSSHDLVNADYYCAIPVTYAVGDWSYRLRLFHISSHLGDEYLLNHPGIMRYNPAIETLDFFASYQFTKELRLYAGVGDDFISDAGFKQHPLYVGYGFELKFDWWRDRCDRLLWRPFLAVYIENREQDGWYFNQNYCLGMEVGRLDGSERKVRLSIEWYDGFSQDGQLTRFRTNYGQLKLAYGF